MEMESHAHLSSEYLLRHWLAAIKFRLAHAVGGAPDRFASFEAGEGVRTPGEILLHMSQLLRNSCSLLDGSARVRFEPVSWEEEVARFHEWIGHLDQAVARLALETPVAEKLIQGPLADVTSHVGQLTMLRRLSGHPVEGVNYLQAPIQTA